MNGAYQPFRKFDDEAKQIHFESDHYQATSKIN